MSDIEKLQEVADDLHAAAAKFESMGLADSFEVVVEAADAIREAGEAVKSFRMTVLVGILASAVAIACVVAYFIIDYAVSAKLAKIDQNAAALEVLNNMDQGIRVDPIVDKSTGTKALAIIPSNSTHLQMSQDGRVFYLILNH
jgi:hypothetical protein